MSVLALFQFVFCGQMVFVLAVSVHSYKPNKSSSGSDSNSVLIILLLIMDTFICTNADLKVYKHKNTQTLQMIMIMTKCSQCCHLARDCRTHLTTTEHCRVAVNL